MAKGAETIPPPFIGDNQEDVSFRPIGHSAIFPEGGRFRPGPAGPCGAGRVGHFRPGDEKFSRQRAEGFLGVHVKLDVGENGGITLDPDLLLETDDLRMHQVRLEGGDASSDSFCFS